MIPDKQVKKQFKLEASKNSEAADTSLKWQKKLEINSPREGGMDGEFTKQ